MGFKPRAIEARAMREHGRENLEQIGAMLDEQSPELAAHLAGTGDPFNRVAVAAGVILAKMAQDGGWLMHVTASGNREMAALIDEAFDAVAVSDNWRGFVATAERLLERPAPPSEPGTPLFEVVVVSFERAVRPRIEAAIARHEREAANR